MLVTSQTVQETCYEPNTDYGISNSILFNNIFDAKECQLKCQLTEKCGFFSYKSEEKRCWLKLDDVAEKMPGNKVTGPRTCPREYYVKQTIEQLLMKWQKTRYNSKFLA